MHLSTSTAYAYKIYFWVPLPKCTKKIIIPSAYLVSGVYSHVFCEQPLNNLLRENLC